MRREGQGETGQRRCRAAAGVGKGWTRMPKSGSGADGGLREVQLKRIRQRPL